MFTEWRYKAQLITTDRAVGDAMYMLLRVFPNDPAPASSMFDIELDGAWACELSVKKGFADIVDEMNGGGYPQALIDAGKSSAEIDALRGIVFVDYYDLHENDAPYTVKPEALDEFIISKGYVRA